MGGSQRAPTAGFFAEENDIGALRKRITELQIENKKLKEGGSPSAAGLGVEENKN
jgi:hypothetical protein